MKIALIGATGNIGKEIAREALRRGHDVTAIVRKPANLQNELPGIKIKVADLFDAAGLREAIAGNDVLASAYGPGAGDPAMLLQTTDALTAAAKTLATRRLVVVGGAGSLEVAPGKQLVDSPNFPAAYKAVALAHREVLSRLQQETDVKWTFFAPAALIGPGEKIGNYRVGRRSLIADASGNSRISYADYADAFVNELERNAHLQEIATVAY